MLFFQRTTMVHGYPKEMIGYGIEVTVRIDDQLTEIMPYALSKELGRFFSSVMERHYALPDKNTHGVDTRIDPWPLPFTIKEYLSSISIGTGDSLPDNKKGEF